MNLPIIVAHLMSEHAGKFVVGLGEHNQAGHIDSSTDKAERVGLREFN
jgi:hypothetical protein